MNIKQLKKLIKDLPDDAKVEVNIVSQGEYYDTDVSAFNYYEAETDRDVLIITVGDSEV